VPTISGPGASATLLGWQLQNNPWGAGSLVYGTDYTMAITYNDKNLANNPTFSWTYPAPNASNRYTVYAYPEIMFGGSPWWGNSDTRDPLAVFPLSMADLTSLTIKYNVTMTGDDGGHNVAFEIWLTDTKGGGSAAITNEVMVLFHLGTMYSTDPGAGTFASGTYTGTIYNNLNWASGWTFTTVQPGTTGQPGADELSGSFDLAVLLAQLKGQGIITGNEYICGLEFGAEVSTGTGTLTFNQLEYDVLSNGLNTILGGTTGTAGADRVQGSNDAETLTGLGGPDILYGYAGNDSLLGGDGNDTLLGGAGNDTLNGGGGIDTAVLSGNRSAYTVTHNVDGSYTVSGTDGTDSLTAVELLQFADQTMSLGVAHSDFNADGKSDILWQNTSGQAGVWLLNGASATLEALVGDNPGTSWKAIGTGDFDGDGHADILWQNTSGQAGIWLMNGITVTSQALVGDNPGTSWKAIGTGDFDGDGKADILWQNTSGQVGIWLMNGTSVTSEVLVGDNPGTSWKAVGAEDVNADGKADLLWQNTSGQAGVWLMNGTSVLSQALVGSNSGSSWHVIAGAGG
jgi:hypothetical protein